MARHGSRVGSVTLARVRNDPGETTGASYADRLKRIQLASWRERIRILDPWGRHLRTLKPGYTLEVGCGIGRNLQFLSGHAVGIDHNPTSVETCSDRGFLAFTPDRMDLPLGTFETLLFSHVLEHLSLESASELVMSYLPYLGLDGRLIAITPQERGFRSDPSHVTLVGFHEVLEICRSVGLQVEDQHSFPFPRRLGPWFIYNEFVTVARRTG
jgi:SAM-dependent methyltransferase